MKPNLPPGSLYIVATPIGNLEDISYRAVRILKEVDWIAAEDTRHSAYLLHHYAIATPLISLHKFNEDTRSELLLSYLKTGKSIALISDAGTPLISDPGYYLVQAVQQAGIAIIPIPGACAAIAALTASGLATDRFVFEGFLPTTKGQRRTEIAQFALEARTVIFYESSHRILRCLIDMMEVLGEDRFIVIAKELTKTFETFIHGTIKEVYSWLTADIYRQKGEFVLLLKGKQPAAEAAVVQPESRNILNILLAKLPLKQAVLLAAEITGEKRNSLYELAIAKKKST